MNHLDINCESLKELVKGFSLVLQCDVVKNGMLRIATPFNYPNGSHIDLFLENTSDIFPDYILSDYGQTADYLLDMHIKPWGASKRRTLIKDVCDSLGVEQHSGRLLIHLKPDNFKDFSGAMVRLAQACIRVSDLSFTQRLQIAGTFQEEVEEFFSGVSLKYELDVVLRGAFGNEVKVDFQTQGKQVTSLVQTLSTPSYTNAHPRSVEVFSRWYDLRDYHNAYQFITLYDASSNIFRPHDLGRLHEVSTVFGYPDEQQQIQEALAA